MPNRQVVLLVTLEPFRALRYDPERVDLASVTAPPYDAIDLDEQRRLYDRDAHNVVRLELGLEHPDEPADNRYTRAATVLHDWLAAGILRIDEEPALWRYEQTFDDGGERRTQRGVVGALEVTPWEAGQVLPHERVFRGPVEDRKRLLTHVAVNLSPVFLLAPDDPDFESALDVAPASPPLEVTDGGGVVHRLTRIADVATQQAIQRALAPLSVLMADGHHRYTTAIEHLDEHGGVGATRVLASIASAARGPVVRPMHRLVRRLPDQAVGRLRTAGFSFHRFDGSPSELAEVVASSDEALFGMVWNAGPHLLEVRDPDAVSRLVPSGTPDLVRRLDITLLQAAVTVPLGVRERVQDLLYTPDVAAASAAVAAGVADALFLVKPLTVGQVREAASAGHLLPPKSTAFYPKPRTGLVMRPLDPTSLAGGTGTSGGSR